MATTGDSATAGGSILHLQSNRAREAATPAELGIFRDSMAAQQLDTCSSSSSSMGPSQFGTLNCLVMRVPIHANSMWPCSIKGTAVRIIHIHCLSPYVRHFHSMLLNFRSKCWPFTLNICMYCYFSYYTPWSLYDAPQPNQGENWFRLDFNFCIFIWVSFQHLNLQNYQLLPWKHSSRSINTGLLWHSELFVANYRSV